MTNDLIESRISEIRERLTAAKVGEFLDLLEVIAHAPSDLEALLAERDGMKAEIERLNADAERLDWLESEHSRVDPVMRLTVKEHHFRGSPLWANVNGAREGIDTARRLAAPLEPSKPTCPDCARPLQKVRYEGGYLNEDQFDSIRAGDWFCEKCPNLDPPKRYRYFWNRDIAARSPDREAGSGTDAKILQNFFACCRVAHPEFRCCCVLPKGHGGDHAQTLGAESFTWASSHPVPSEGGGE